VRAWRRGHVRRSGEADATDPVLADVLAEEYLKHPEVLVVDLSGLEFMDSSALRVLLRAAKRLEAAGRALRLVNPVGEVRRVLELIGADQLMPVFATVEDAAG
jgi:anti-sigma B factor antagonist